MSQRFFKENGIITSLLCALLCIAFYDVVFLNKTFKITTANPQALYTGPFGQENNKPSFFPVLSTDSSVIEEPIYEFIKTSLKKGILPLWNPHQACGYPLIGMMQVGMFFPLNWILYLLPQLYAWDILILSRFLLAGLFTYWFMRTLRYGKIPSLGAAIVYMFSGPMVLVQYWFANVEILTPLLLLSLERLIQKPDRRRCCLLAIVVAATFFAGHPEHVFFVNVLGFLFFCFRILSIKPRCHLPKVLSCLARGYALGLGLSAIVLFPFLRNLASEFWNNHPPDTGLRTDGVKRSLITIVLPYFFQKEPVTLRFDHMGWWGGYMGILPVGLAFLSLFTRQRHKLNYFLCLIAVLIIAKGYFNSPLVNWIGYLPIFRHSRFFIHTVHLFAFLIAVLAGMGISVLLARRIRYLKTKYMAAIILVFLVLELFSYIPRGRVHRFDSFPKVPYIEVLRNTPQRARAYGIFWTLYPNTATGYGVDDLGIFMGLLPKRFVHFINHFIMPDHFKKDMGHSAFWSVPVTFIKEPKPYLNLLNVKYTVAPKRLFKTFPRASSANFQKPFYSEEVYLYEHTNAFPRAFIVHRAVFEPDEDLLIEKMRRMKNELRIVALVNHPDIPEITRKLRKTPLIDNSSARIVKYTPNEVVIEADMKNAGFLVLSDGFHPDWKAFVNGKQTKIYITDYLIRSVFLPQGEHVVRFSFQPFSFYSGALLSLISLILLVIILSLRRNSPQRQSYARQ